MRALSCLLVIVFAALTLSLPHSFTLDLPYIVKGVSGPVTVTLSDAVSSVKQEGFLNYWFDESEGQKLTTLALEDYWGVNAVFWTKEDVRSLFLSSLCLHLHLIMPPNS